MIHVLAICWCTSYILKMSNHIEEKQCNLQIRIYSNYRMEQKRKEEGLGMRHIHMVLGSSFALKSLSFYT